MKDRDQQRKNRRMKHKEEKLEKQDCCGIKDLTPYNAVERIRRGCRAEIALK